MVFLVRVKSNGGIGKGSQDVIEEFFDCDFSSLVYTGSCKLQQDGEVEYGKFIL